MRTATWTCLVFASSFAFAACSLRPDHDLPGGAGGGSGGGKVNTGSSPGNSGGASADDGGTLGGGPAAGGGAPVGGSGQAGGQQGAVGGSGGATSDGGAPGVGGSVEQTLTHGFLPETAFEKDARDAYDAWKAIHLEDCSGGVYRVRWENARLDATVSEGIGYGMLLAVAWDDRTIFDGFFEYSKKMRNGNNLMNWLRYGCDAHREIKYELKEPDNAAADADLDVAMALLMAECRWGDSKYGSEADTVIGAIKQHMFIEENGKKVLIPGDAMDFHTFGGGCVNYSYFAPGYYRAFGEHVPADKAFWDQAARDTYALLGTASNGSTGLVRNWGSSNGGDAGGCAGWYTRPGSYGDDAARTPWRIATDYLWYGAPEAKAWNDKVTDWVSTVGIDKTVQWYKLDGSPDTEADTYSDHTAINVGPFAVGAMTKNVETVSQFAAEVVRIPAGEGAHDGEYFPRMLKALSLLTLTGNFTTCGGKE